MRTKFAYLIVLLLTTSLILSACAQPATQAPPAAQATEAPMATEAMGQEVTAVIGFTVSQTGSLNVESTRQTNGLNLWMDQVNSAGGIKLSDGTVVKFESKFYDDESNKDRVQELYTRLATEDNANFLISPYSSGLADAAAVIAEQYSKIMITTGAASDSTYKKGYTLVFQAYTPASKYLTGAADLLKATDSSATKIAIVHENDKFSTDVSTALIMGGGHFQDGTTFAKQLYEKQLPVKFISILVAPPEPSFAELGDAAYGIIGPSQWEPLAAFTEESAKAAGLDWYGPTGADFVSAYKAAYNEDPSYHSAGGYEAGLLLQRAIEQADSMDTQAVKSALDSFDVLTFFGHIKFDTSAEAHGLQVGHSMVYIQWQKDDSGNLVKQVVWPAEGATAKVIYPIR
jgi:ABC-type branched-subunit amino acid transport system substrate-binding protein